MIACQAVMSSTRLEDSANLFRLERRAFDPRFIEQNCRIEERPERYRDTLRQQAVASPRPAHAPGPETRCRSTAASPSAQLRPTAECE